MLAPVEHGNRQGRHAAGIEIRRHAGKGDRVETLGKLRVVGDQKPAGGAAEALVGAHCHQVRALGQRIGPGTAGDDAALVGGVEKHPCADLVGNGANLRDRMGKQVEAATDGNQFRRDRARQFAQRIEIDGIAVRIDRSVVDVQAVKPGRNRPGGGSRGRRCWARER